MKSNIIVNLQVEGIHCWPDCPIEEVAFLRTPHRHIFQIECKKEVTHLDRDIEIIQFNRKIQDYLLNKYGTGRSFYNLKKICDFGSKSCEMIAVELVGEFQLNYCKVLEDGENGAEVQL